MTQKPLLPLEVGHVRPAPLRGLLELDAQLVLLQHPQPHELRSDILWASNTRALRFFSSIRFSSRLCRPFPRGPVLIPLGVASPRRCTGSVERLQKRGRRIGYTTAEKSDATRSAENPEHSYPKKGGGFAPQESGDVLKKTPTVLHPHGCATVQRPLQRKKRAHARAR